MSLIVDVWKSSNRLCRGIAAVETFGVNVDLLELFATSFNRKPMNFLAETSFTYFPKWRNKIKVNFLVLQHSLLHRCFSINLQNMSKHLKYLTGIWYKAFKNELSKISWRQPLKYLQRYWKTDSDTSVFMWISGIF